MVSFGGGAQGEVGGTLVGSPRPGAMRGGGGGGGGGAYGAWIKFVSMKHNISRSPTPKATRIPDLQY